MTAWTKARKDYLSLIVSPDRDSRYLREHGLIPNTLALAGDCCNKVVLDAGTGNCWLFDHIRPRAAHACDIVAPENVPENVEFRQEDVACLSYRDACFDVLVAGLLIMFCRNIGKVLREFHRVTKPDGAVVISLVHPYFYRTGHVVADGGFLVVDDLSHERQFEVRIGGDAGPFTYFYRPLPTYLNALADAGWRIVETRDWFIGMDEYARYLESGGRSNLRRTGRVPLYSFIKATRVDP